MIAKKSLNYCIKHNSVSKATKYYLVV